MKRLLCVVLMGLAVTAQADEWRHRGWHQEPHYAYRTGGDWVGPAIIGGIIGYELGRPRYNPPVVVAPPPVVYPPVSSPPYPPYGYHYEQMLDAYCNCYRTVLVQN